MHFIIYRVVLVIFLSGFFILSLHGCESKEKNPLIGHWVSEGKLLAVTNPNYKEVQLEFTADSMLIDKKKIPVIYKLKNNQVVLFSRGEKVIAHILSESKMILFLRVIGKRIYIKQND